jgi:putative tryptophan/tyrosine transport system substrate-binding protein
MRRRQFIALLGGAAATWSSAGHAQQPERMRRVGVLLPFDKNDPEAKNRLRQFRLGMRDLDWIEGRNALIDFWFSGGNLESIKRSVAELIKAAPEVIVVHSTPGLAAVRRATSTIPIVFVTVSDPVGQGFVPSLAHPGGNITGFSFIEPEIVGKWINLLSELKPGLSRATLMFNPDTAPFHDSSYRSLKTAPRPSVEVEVAHVRTADEIESTIAKLGNDQSSGLILGADNFLVNRREPIIKLANERGVPTVSAIRQFAVDGSLASYGPDTGDISRRSSAYVDRILRGERPGNLPIQSPTRYELVVNLKTAKALGLPPRESFLELCDEVIE